MNGFRFAEPWWFTLAVPAIAATMISIRRERRGAVLYSSVGLVAQLPQTFSQRIKRLLPWFRCFACLLIVVALTRPQAGLSAHRVRADGIAIAVCLDRSGSMEALDFQWEGKEVNRLVAVKNVLRDFVAGKGTLNGRPDDLIGLIVFGGFAESKVPLTLDHGMLLEVLESVDIPQPIFDSRGNIINQRYFEEERATAIGDAVTLAVDRLKGSQAKSKVLIFLSDGENTAGIIQPEEAAAAAKEFGIKIYSIGVGRNGLAPFPFLDRFGRQVFKQQMVRLDEKTLKMLANTTGGKYFHAQDTSALEQVYAEIDTLEKTVSEGTTYMEYRELFQWLLLPGIALVVTEVLLRSTRLRSWP
jgi:Ca-activated chloride channel family protein